VKALLDSFWRAGAYCLHPKVIGLSLLPLLIGVALALGLGYLYWESAVAGVRATLENWSLVDAALKWVESLVGASFRAVLAPLIVVGLAAPVIVLVSVLLVAWLMTPAIVDLAIAQGAQVLVTVDNGIASLAGVAHAKARGLSVLVTDHHLPAQVDGAIVPLTFPLANGQTVEIITTREGGPSRDWLNPQLGFTHSSRARNKVRQWFNAQNLATSIAQGRSLVERELQRRLAAGALEDEVRAATGGEPAHGAGVPVIMVPDLLPATPPIRARALAIAPDLATVGSWLAAAHIA
jgi:hypothetical protein